MDARDRHRRRTRRWALATVGFLALAACSNDRAPTATDRSPTEVSTTSTSTRPSTGPTTTLAKPASFDEAVDGASSQINAAGTDGCRLIELAGWLSDFPAPDTHDEARRAVDVITRYLHRTATGVRDELPEAAAQLDRSADAIADDARAVGYDPATINSPRGLISLNSDGLLSAMGELNRYADGHCR